MANCLKEACSTAVAGARVVKETAKFVARNTTKGVKFIGSNANRGASFVLYNATKGLDKIANKIAETSKSKVQEEVKNEVNA